MLSGDPSLHMFSCSLILEGRMTVTMDANLSHARVANCEMIQQPLHKAKVNTVVRRVTSLNLRTTAGEELRPLSAHKRG